MTSQTLKITISWYKSLTSAFSSHNPFDCYSLICSASVYSSKKIHWVFFNFHLFEYLKCKMSPFNKYVLSYEGNKGVNSDETEKWLIQKSACFTEVMWAET
jgi:hypothetical protein